MNRIKTIIVLLLIFLLGAVVYAFFIPKDKGELDESSPLAKSPSVTDEIAAKDNLESMSPASRAELEKAVAEMADQEIEMSDPELDSADLLAQGDFTPRAHQAQGQALLIDDDGQQTLRFENFETENGPDLYIYLSADLSATDFVDLGRLRATRGNINYTIPEGTDISKYKYALVWCKAFRVLFSYAELQSL